MNSPQVIALPDAEAAILGALLWSNEDQGQILASVSHADFATPEVSRGWHWASSQTGTDIDAAKFGVASGLSVAYLCELAGARPTWQLWQNDAAEVVRAANLRRLSGFAANMLTEAAAHGADPLVIAERHGHALGEFAKGAKHGNCFTIADLLPGVIDYIQRLHQGSHDAAGIPTGYDELDKASPLRPGELTILAARPGIGKSALAMNLACNMARCGWPVGFVSLEMTARALCARVLQSEARACIASVGKDGNMADFARLTTAVANVQALPLVICQPGRMTCSALRRIARQLVSQYKAKCLVVDYLQLILPDQRSNSRNRENEVAEASATAKGIAVDCQVPLVMLAQLNRSAEGDKPKLSQLRDSGAIEQDADVVWLLDRDRGDDTGATRLTIAKNRDGDGGGVIPLRFSGRHTRFDPDGTMSHEKTQQKQATKWCGKGSF